MAKRGFQGAVLRSFGAHDHEVTVSEVEFIAPKFLRIHFTTQTLFDEISSAPTAWLRFWFPDPTGKDIEHQRAYTISIADDVAGTFAVDFVLHEPAGPASAWAATAQPGMSLAVTSLGTSRFEVPEELPAGYLLIGDPASTPALSSIIRVLPDELPIELYLEQHDEDDRLIPLPQHPRLRVHWVYRQTATSLADAINNQDWSNWYAWALPESASLKFVRARLKDEFGFPKTELHQQAYWVHGRAMGKLRSSEKPEEAVVEKPQLEVQEKAPSTARGTWRSQSAGRLLASLRTQFIISGIVQAIITLIQLAPFFLLVELAQLLLNDASSTQLWTVGLWAVGLMGVGALLSSALLFCLHLVDARFEQQVRHRLIDKLSKLPLGWFDKRTSGQVKQLVQDDTLALHYLVTHAVVDAVAAVIAPVSVLVYLFIVDWRLALILLIPVIVYLFTMASMMIQSGAKTAQALSWAEKMNSEAGSYLAGQPVIRVFGGAAASIFRARLSEYIRFLNEWQRPFTRQKTIMDLVTRPTTFLLLIIVFGTLLVSCESMSAVELLPFLLLGTTFGSRLLGIGYGLSGLRTGLLAARRIQVTLEESELSVMPDESKTAQHSKADSVEFQDVTFSYRPGVPVLQNISLRLKPGTLTALVGSSGSGKSTLAALLARFHDIDSGSIKINGQDIRSMSADELYSQVGFVFQRTQLVHGTVADNIALARPDATREQIEQAAQAAQLHERIQRMPHGYDTVLDSDAGLSGGERQRLTIARALLADTPILVLDEATAFADPESEYLVQQALNELSAGRTVLVIAHRLRTITEADCIVVLDNGHIAQSGTHQELLLQAGKYRQLWDADGTVVPVMKNAEDV